MLCTSHQGLQQVTPSAQEQYERVSKVLFDPLHKSVAPQIDMKGLNVVLEQLVVTVETRGGR